MTELSPYFFTAMRSRSFERKTPCDNRLPVLFPHECQWCFVSHVYVEDQQTDQPQLQFYCHIRPYAQVVINFHHRICIPIQPYSQC